MIKTIAHIEFEFVDKNSKRSSESKAVIAEVSSNRGGMMFEGDTMSNSIILARSIVSTLREVRNNPHGIIRMLGRKDIHVEANLYVADRKVPLSRVINDNPGKFVQALLLDEFRRQVDLFREAGEKKCLPTQNGMPSS